MGNLGYCKRKRIKVCDNQVFFCKEEGPQEYIFLFEVEVQVNISLLGDESEVVMEEVVSMERKVLAKYQGIQVRISLAEQGHVVVVVVVEGVLLVQT